MFESYCSQDPDAVLFKKLALVPEKLTMLECAACFARMQKHGKHTFIY